ncbi:PA domain-containing protein [Sinomonas halotolerans]|uniref:PA domain-containing protein n=1 Tax=Sinomonas halotolerans TaxID=1644133 RepID=A0ABU9WY84_9MICC
MAGGPAVAHEAILDDGIIDNAGATHGHHEAQHGGDEGHLPAGSENVGLISKLGLKNVEPGKIADVGVHNGYAYLAAWGGETCKYNGVHVVDIRDVDSPKEVAFIQSKEGSAPGEGIQSIHIDTPAFTGDILVSNNEVCKVNGGKAGSVGFGGMNIYDVTNPAHPTFLAEGAGDENVSGQGKKAAHSIHSVFAWDAGDKAYAVIVDNDEAADVDIMDITNPRKPALVAEYDLAKDFPQILQEKPASLTSVFHHDVVVKQIDGRQVMLISYWDGGYVTLDVTDPAAAAYIGDSDFALQDPQMLEVNGVAVAPEGNAHQAEFTGDSQFILAADEDFSPFGAQARNEDDGTPITAGQGAGPGGTTVTGPSVFVGRACDGDPAVPAGDPGAVDIAVVERGVCTFTEKAQNVEAAGGWDGILVFNRTGSDPGACSGSFGMSVESSLPTYGVAPRAEGYAIFDVESEYNEAACVAGNGTQLAPIAVGTVGDTLTLASTFDGWGYVHLFENNGGKLNELDTYAIPEAMDPAYATGSGDLSVHEVAVSHAQDDLAYVSYYAGGLRVIRIVDGEIVEVGKYIDEGGNNFWGVETFTGSDGKEYVAASDRDAGLYIFEYTGP